MAKWNDAKGEYEEEEIESINPLTIARGEERFRVQLLNELAGVYRLLEEIWSETRRSND